MNWTNERDKMAHDVYMNRQSPFELGIGEVSDETIKEAKKFLIDKIVETYFSDGCMADTLTSTSSYPYLDDWEMDDASINECIFEAMKKIANARKQ